ncbi:hypothetical protein ACQUSR_05155 [Streptomyces sp. P1-3]|uniref:hypothetical protein n=1 Tax=Streptomyces sp. P1-3 TaxID=3421658 RepID=UPI003D361351
MPTPTPADHPPAGPSAPDDTAFALTAEAPQDGSPAPASGAEPWYRTGGTDAAPHPAGPPPYPPATADHDDASVRTRTRTRARAATAAACLVLGLGLLVGAAAGSWLTGGPDDRPTAEARFAQARAAWHSVPVDGLFPPVLKGREAGPGGADRTWIRIAVAPDSSCGGAFDPLLDKALSPVGCKRLLRATYTDATSTSVTTVGVLVTRADADGMRALRKRFTGEALDRRADLMPRPYPAKGTAAAEFGDKQRATWRIGVLTDAPAIVYTVTGFVDGRTVGDPRPAKEATAKGATSTPALSGLGHDAVGVAKGIERAFRAAVSETEGSR